MIHDPYYIAPRDRLSPKQKLQMFIAAEGICCVCLGKIDHVREAWDEHVNPLWLNGTNDAPNRAPAHEKCAITKTGAEATLRAKIRATAERHFGAKDTRSRPIPGSRRSPWKRNFDGTTTRRETHDELQAE